MVKQNRQNPNRRPPAKHCRNMPRLARILPHAIVAAVCAWSFGISPAVAATPTDAEPSPTPETAQTVASDLHAPWTRLLASYVRDGTVDYKKLGSQSRGEFDAYLAALQAVPPEVLNASSRNAQLAFWINAYNAFTVDLVLDHYPIDGIWNVTPFWKRAFGGPFAIDYIPLGSLAPKPTTDKISLDYIENEILRAHFKEPLIHFVIVCASVSCPALASEAYTGEALAQQLEASTRTFLATETKNHYESATNTLAVSQIFKWFAEDLDPGGGAVGYFRKYGPAAEGAQLEEASSAPQIEFMEYDWSLNGP
jgi:hypothetical protein